MEMGAIRIYVRDVEVVLIRVSTKALLTDDGHGINSPRLLCRYLLRSDVKLFVALWSILLLLL
jgi:hypothetical protein